MVHVPKIYVYGSIILFVIFVAILIFFFLFFYNNNLSIPGITKKTTLDNGLQTSDIKSDFQLDKGDATQGELIFLENMSKEHTNDEFREIYREAVERAEKTEYIDVSRCNIKPLVYDLEGTSFQMRNTDNIIHVISISESESYAIQPEQTISVSFNRETGAYGYGCDGGPFAKGVILVR